MLLLFVGFVIITFLMCIAEVVFERDWPRATIGRFITSLALLCAWVWLT